MSQTPENATPPAAEPFDQGHADGIGSDGELVVNLVVRVGIDYGAYFAGWRCKPLFKSVLRI